MSQQQSNTQEVGPGTITGPMSDTRTFSHTGAEIGSSNVTLEQNTTGREDVILRWTMPKKYNAVRYAAGKHPTTAELRHRVDRAGFNGTTVDLSGEADLLPVGGETEIDEQPWPVVTAVNTTSGDQIDVVDADYSANEITLASDPGGDDLALWPAIADGYVKYVGENQFEQRVGPLDPWGIPSHVFVDFKQDKNETRIHLVGAASFTRDEALALTIEAPYQVVWQDSDYPDTYASKWQQKVDVDL